MRDTILGIHGLNNHGAESSLTAIVPNIKSWL